MLSYFLDFLFPKQKKVLTLESKEITSLPPAPSDLQDKNTLALFDYRDKEVKEMVWQIKYAGNYAVAQKFGAVLYDVIFDELSERGQTSALLLPIPISDRRRLERGWNQAELICEAIETHDIQNFLKHLPKELKKIRHTESQTKTSGKRERLRNLHESMEVLNPLSFKNQFVIVVDDVVTTGSTFKEARRALKDARVKKILCIALAH